MLYLFSALQFKIISLSLPFQPSLSTPNIGATDYNKNNKNYCLTSVLRRWI